MAQPSKFVLPATSQTLYFQVSAGQLHLNSLLAPQIQRVHTKQNLHLPPTNICVYLCPLRPISVNGIFKPEMTVPLSPLLLSPIKLITMSWHI